MKKKRIVLFVLIALGLVSMLAGCQSVQYRPTKITAVVKEVYMDETFEAKGQMIITYTDDGYQITLLENGEIGEETEVITFESDPDGNVTTIEYRDDPNSTPYKTENFTYEWDEKGNLRKEECTYGDGDSKHVKTFDEHGNCVVEYSYGTEKNYSYVYDKNGNVIRKIYKDGDYIEYIYDENNRLMKELEAGRYEITFSYDSDGKLVQEKETSFNGEGQTTLYSYDEQGNLVVVACDCFDGGAELQAEMQIEYETTTNETVLLPDAMWFWKEFIW